MITFTLDTLLLRGSLLFFVKFDHRKLFGGVKLCCLGLFFLGLKLFRGGISVGSLNHRFNFNILIWSLVTL